MDTIDLAADSLGSRQALVGHRVSTIVGDTIVGGRRLWIVRDSATVQYVEQVLIDETSLDTLVTMSRKTSGIVRGQMLYDAQLGLFRARDDTTTLDGIAELRYPDGRSFRKRARDEVMRRLTTYDAREYTARRDSVQRERMRNSGGVVFVPANDVDQRLTKGDTVVRDSLVRDWRAADDPNDWLFLYGRLRMWTHDPAFVKRLEQMRIAQGDSAFLLQSLAQRPYSHAYGSGPIDTTTMRTLIRVMGDPALPYAFGVQPSELYDEMAQALTTYPPAAIPDSSRWPCTLEACRLLAGHGAWPPSRD